VAAVLVKGVFCTAIGSELEKERLEGGLEVHGHTEPWDRRTGQGPIRASSRRLRARARGVLHSCFPALSMGRRSTMAAQKN
jgi:hypothetical protein